MFQQRPESAVGAKSAPAAPVQTKSRVQLKGLSFAEQEAALDPRGGNAPAGGARPVQMKDKAKSPVAEAASSSAAPEECDPSAPENETAPAESAAAGPAKEAAGPAKGAPAAPEHKSKDKVALGGGGYKGPFGLGMKASPDGLTGFVEGKYSLPLAPIPIIPGIFLEPSATLKGGGSVSIGAGGAFKGTIGGTLEAALTITGGIPKVCSVFAGAKAVVSVKGFEVACDKDGVWSTRLPEAALKVAITIGAQMGEKFTDSPSGWSAAGMKLEWNPGGELELLTVDGVDGDIGVHTGKDVKRIVEELDKLCEWAGALNPFQDDMVRYDIEAGKHEKASTEERIGMIKKLMSGACLVDDERAIIKVLDVSSEKGDLEKVLAGLDRSALIGKVNDDSDSKTKLSRYLKKPTDASGTTRPGRFSALFSPTCQLASSKGAVKLEDGTGWIQSPGMIAVLRKNTYLEEFRAMVAASDANGGWLPMHKHTKAVAIEQNNELAYTLYFDSDAAAQAAVASASPLLKGRLNAF
ncbi:MAG: hypothetical protein U1F43_06665 [Myxococcota bacterium]